RLSGSNAAAASPRNVRRLPMAIVTPVVCGAACAPNRRSMGKAQQSGENRHCVQKFFCQRRYYGAFQSRINLIGAGAIASVLFSTKNRWPSAETSYAVLRLSKAPNAWIENSGVGEPGMMTLAVVLILTAMRRPVGFR